MDGITMTSSPIVNRVLSNVQLSPQTVNRSWYEEIEEFEQQESTADRSQQDASGNNSFASDETLSKAGNSSENDPNVSGEREIVVKFLDSSNEEKYDRLVKEEKIKTPLKRRLSPNSIGASSSDSSRSTSPLYEEGEAREHQTERKSKKEGISKRIRVDSDGSAENAQRKIREYETDEGVLSRRQKQIDYGKNTVGYDVYVKQVPKESRTKEDPCTPPKNHKYSRRAFDGLIKVWRKKLHCYDPANANCDQNE